MYWNITAEQNSETLSSLQGRLK